MDTNRLSKTLTAALNSQMTKEAYASQIYLSYAAGGDKVNNNALYSLDRDLKNTPDGAGSAQDVTAEKP